MVRLGTGYLGRHGSSSARLDAELLTAHALGLRRLDLYLQYDRMLTTGELAAARELMRRRAAGEPVAYLTGRREFYGRSFAVGPAVLVPRPETEILVERTLVWARERGGGSGAGLVLADLGSGSGCIAVTLAAELPSARVVATDASPEALAIAAANATALGVDARFCAREGSWADPLRGHIAADAAVSNPPYVTTAEIEAVDRDVRDFEPRAALDGGADGLDAYPALFDSLAGVLRPGGFVAVEVDPRRAGAVAEMARARWPGGAVHTTRDLSGRDRVVEVCDAG